MIATSALMLEQLGPALQVEILETLDGAAEGSSSISVQLRAAILTTALVTQRSCEIPKFCGAHCRAP